MLLLMAWLLSAKSGHRGELACLAPAVGSHAKIPQQTTSHCRTGDLQQCHSAGFGLINIQHTAVQMKSQTELSSSPFCIREDAKGNG